MPRTRALRYAAAATATIAVAVTLTACSQPAEPIDPAGPAACQVLIDHGAAATSALDDLTVAVRMFNTAAGFANRIGDTDQVDHNLEIIDGVRRDAELTLANTTTPAHDQAHRDCATWLDSLQD